MRGHIPGKVRCSTINQLMDLREKVLDTICIILKTSLSQQFFHTMIDFSENPDEIENQNPCLLQ